ncbi:hypothetical protein [Aquimarina sp. SS2-1]|uniref:hypothetical protein n=1 Tax=Aquimarina besae TaxID=3342247 RepID=UPI00366E7268
MIGKKNIKQDRDHLFYNSILILSLLLFFTKGIQYAILGSYIPIILSTTIIIVFYISRKNKKFLNTVLKIWSFLIIAWSLIRLLIAAVDHFGKELMENHLQENLGFLGSLVSICFLIAGFYLFNKKRRYNWLFKNFEQKIL